MKINKNKNLVQVLIQLSPRGDFILPFMCLFSTTFRNVNLPSQGEMVQAVLPSCNSTFSLTCTLDLTVYSNFVIYVFCACIWYPLNVEYAKLTGSLESF